MQSTQKFNKLLVTETSLLCDLVQVSIDTKTLSILPVNFQHSAIFLKYLLIKQTNKILLWYCSHYGTSEIWKLSLYNMHFLASFAWSNSKILNFNVLLYTIIFTYVTFADQFSGLIKVLEVDYDSYAIVKHSSNNSSQSKYVF